MHLDTVAQTFAHFPMNRIADHLWMFFIWQFHPKNKLFGSEQRLWRTKSHIIKAEVRMNEGDLREIYAFKNYIIMHMNNERPNSLSYLCMINHSQSYIKSPCIYTYIHNHTPILYTYTHFHLTQTVQRKGVHSAGFQSSQETMDTCALVSIHYSLMMS